MDDTEALPTIDLEEELDSGEWGHGYVVCNYCTHKEKPGAMVVTLCGKVIRLGDKRRPYCPECKRVRSEIVPAMVPCTFCGHLGA
jgi:transposase-like protein